MASNIDRMTGLPFEVKANICAQLADILAEDPQARRYSLKKLRLTNHAWSEPPCPLLFRALRAELWGSRGLHGLLDVTRRGDFSRHIRSLAFDINIPLGNTKPADYHYNPNGPVSFDFVTAAYELPEYLYQGREPNSIVDAAERAAVSVLRRRRSLATQSQCDDQSGLRELFRHIFSALTSLDDLIIGSPVRSEQEKLRERYRWKGWAHVSSALTKALLLGFLDSGACVTRMSITGYPATIRVLELLSPLGNAQPPTLSAATSRLAKLQLHVVSLPYNDAQYTRRAMAPFFSRLWLLTSLEYSAQLLDLDIGRPPVKRWGPESAPHSLSSLDRVDYIRLKSLTLRSFDIGTAAGFITFLTHRTPVLEQLHLDGTWLGRDESWWDLFASIREHCRLKRLRLSDSLLYEGLGPRVWFISPKPDPRPLQMEDCIEHAELEAWVTGADISDPRWRVQAPEEGRVIVWNAGSSD